jgi:hypothetical protein
MVVEPSSFWQPHRLHPRDSEDPSSIRQGADRSQNPGVQCRPRVQSPFDRIETPGGGFISFIGMQDQNVESVKSLEVYDIAFVEEAQTLSARSLAMLRPSIQKQGSELWFTWNRRCRSDPVDEFFREAPDNRSCQRQGSFPTKSPGRLASFRKPIVFPKVAVV